MMQRWRFVWLPILYEMMTLKIWYHVYPSRLTGVFLAKPIPNRYLQIGQFVKAAVAKNNVHRGATAKAKSTCRAGLTRESLVERMEGDAPRT
jgi:hypothetical protein